MWEGDLTGRRKSAPSVIEVVAMTDGLKEPGCVKKVVRKDAD